MINKYLSTDMFNILNEIDHSHSGTLIFEPKGGWFVDEFPIRKSNAIDDLYRMRLIYLSGLENGKQIWKMTKDGSFSLKDYSYTPGIINV